ncbi:cold shock and DUF1294 domain-containing protein [Mitsuaria sp. BK037]|uniref:DUF1294 domain-containing protein n=1 Tax=Mitsuaria sp. BK037 TaxID=2587122 RepID=UPI00162228CD|nr:cold shock and DUF1294 domain-containing protein [Mitsuaria sp. BK037]MBB3281959.1 uncharacterized membrane protein YsdA (DUF1294 family)/cold shock CspA family protein [Mitsuaria sp. BK037]
MRVEGRIVQWDDAKGYGFIAPSDGGPKRFVHISAFGLRARRPFVGERVSYQPGADAQGKPRALEVRSLEPKPAPAGPAPRPGGAARPRDRAQPLRGSAPSSKPSADTGASLWLVPGFATLVLLTHLAWPLPRGLWGTYVAMSFATFIVYALDKRAARLGQWRVKESTLHGLALLCGWPGALLAQHLLRHKSAKPGFRRVFWLSVALNILAFVCLFTPLLSPFFSGISDHWNTRSAGDFV